VCRENKGCGFESRLIQNTRWLIGVKIMPGSIPEPNTGSENKNIDFQMPKWLIFKINFEVWKNILKYYFIVLLRWCLTGVPRNNRVPWDGVKGFTRIPSQTWGALQIKVPQALNFNYIRVPPNVLCLKGCRDPK